MAVIIALVVGLMGITSVAETTEMEIYNTKLATSDLLWARHSSQEDGWEEVSNYDVESKNVIRSYQVCMTNAARDDVNNWIRSPYIDARDGKRIYIDIEFSIDRCFTDLGKNAKCKETFNIYYYEAGQDVASSTFPPWQEKPYVKIDTVAANAVARINKKTFSFGPVSRKGFYIAVQDQGSCMSFMSMRAYFYQCPKSSRSLSTFPATVSGAEPASLVPVVGQCITNSIKIDKDPVYRCSSDGRWQILTGGCHCDVGYQAQENSTVCHACPYGSYKLFAGNEACQPCPANSGPQETSILAAEPCRHPAGCHNNCPCWPGYARVEGEPVSTPCTGPPSSPRSLNVTFNATSATLRWEQPRNDGGRSDLRYSIQCKVSSTSRYLPSERYRQFRGTRAVLPNLRPHTAYTCTVRADNAVSGGMSDSQARSAEISFTTEEAAPSSVTNVRVSRERESPSSVITWQPPTKPNGKILGYEVELSRSTKFAPEKILSQTTQNTLHLDNLVYGQNYIVRVRAKNSAGFGTFSDPVSMSVQTPGANEPQTGKESNTVIVIAVAISIFLVVLVLLLVCQYRRTGKVFCLRTSGVAKKQRRLETFHKDPGDCFAQERLIVALPPPGQRIYVDYPDPQKGILLFAEQIDEKNIKIEDIIGTGEFAEVCRGKMCFPGSQEINVAVKRLKRGYSKRDESNFLREAATMAQFHDPNIVELKGVVTKAQPFMIVTEYMENRSLDKYLQLNKGTVSIAEIVAMLRGIASGMRYLSNMKYVHRDLAARNILVNSDLVCKVSDFGLSRILENDPHATYTTQGGKIAIRWTAPECIRFRQFTSASDVWSYGIVMWEVFSYGEKPYWDMTNQEVIENIDKGMRLPSPTNCPKAMHDVMLDCWSVEPAKRPDFGELVRRIDDLVARPDLLLPPGGSACGTTRRADIIKMSETPNLSRAMNSGNVTTVEQWLEIQRLSGYSDQFRQRGIDNLDKVANLTINDLKELGINVTLHINKLENGIRTLKRHLSTASASTSPRSSDVSDISEEGESLMLESAQV